MSHEQRVNESWPTYIVRRTLPRTHTHTLFLSHTNTHTHSLSHTNTPQHMRIWHILKISHVTQMSHDVMDMNESHVTHSKHTHKRGGLSPMLLQRPATATHCSKLPHTATHCNTMQQTLTHCSLGQTERSRLLFLFFRQSTFDIFEPTVANVTHCNTLQRTATHCNALQHTAIHCITLQHTATLCNALQHTAT